MSRLPFFIRRFAACRSLATAVALSCFLLQYAAAAEAQPPSNEETTSSDDNADKSPLVQEITVRGNRRVSKGTILRLIRTRIGRPFNARIWEQDWNRLTDSGYFLNVYTYDPEPWPGGIRLTIEVVENARVGKLEFKGFSSLKATEIMDVIKTREGGVYLEGQVHEDKIALARQYKKKAFRDARVDYEVEVMAEHADVIMGRERRIADDVRVTFKADEGRPVSVQKISFVGNKVFSDADLKKAMSSRERRLFRAGDLKDADLEFDQKRLEAHYLRQGYMDIKVEPADVDLSEKTYFNWFRRRKRLATVKFNITEGPQYFTATVSFKGAETLTEEELTAVMKIKPNSVFSDFIAEEDCGRLRSLYGERGRVFARIQAHSTLITDAQRLKELERQKRKSKHLYDVIFEIHEGAEVSLRDVVTRGNLKTKDKVLIRELNLFPGDRLDTTKVEAAKQSLRNLDFFEQDVRISIEPTESPEEADLLIEVAEKPTGEFNFGVGYSVSDSVMGSFNLTQRNFDWRDFPKSWRDFISGNSFIGAGQRFSLGATVGLKKQTYQLSFSEPWTFDRPIRTGFTVARTATTFDEYKESSNSLSLFAGRRLWNPRWDADLTYTIALNEIGEISRYYPPILRRHEGNTVLSSITPRIIYDGRDSRILPSKGLLFQADVEFGGGPLLGDISWVKPSVRMSRWFTVYKTAGGNKHVLEMGGRASLIEAYGQTDDPPFFMRFYAGGPDSIRGFERRTVTPRQSGYQIGGKKIATGSVEYSIPLYEEIIRASAFVDAGSVWDAGKTDPGARVTNDSGFRASFGIGLSIRTPFSPMPLRFYIARPLIKNDEDEIKAFDFSFATRF